MTSTTPLHVVEPSGLPDSGRLHVATTPGHHAICAGARTLTQ
ncbi:hypothetical protein [Streptomyces sp. SA15]|nr:hypothetical protein [Streptomyces sp. SA15]